LQEQGFNSQFCWWFEEENIPISSEPPPNKEAQDVILAASETLNRRIEQERVRLLHGFSSETRQR
jgi:hypothetical protein